MSLSRWNGEREVQTDHQTPVHARIQRLRRWLAVHFIARAGTLLAAALMASMDRFAGQVEWLLLVTVVLGSTWLHAAWWRSARRRPDGWPPRACAIAALDVSALWAVYGFRPSWPGGALSAVVVAVEVGAAVLASRALSAPLSPELGAAPVDVAVKLRTGFPPGLGRLGFRPRRLGTDEAVLTDDAIVVTVRNNLKWAARMTIRLESALFVGSRPAEQSDNPWIQVGGWTMDVPPGDVLVVRQAVGLRVVPCLDAAAFSEIVRVRADLVQGRAIPAPVIRT